MTAISWTDETWNPVTGCSHVSDGCRNCYAEALSLKRGWSLKPWTAPNAAENVVLHPDRLRKPLGWKTPKRVFVNSMSDVFHELVPDDFVDKMFDVMEAVPMHTFQILTKRPDRMATYIRHRYGWDGALHATRPMVDPPAHIWLGTSIEDGRVLGRLASLENVPAAVKFISAEPLIGPLLRPDFGQLPGRISVLAAALTQARVSWVIVGGESGPGFRPMNMAWAREVRDACIAADIAFFFKQDAAFRTETRTFLVEPDGSRWTWQQYPDDRREPVPA